MLAKIFSLILLIINSIIMFIIKIVLNVFPTFDFTGFTSVINAFFGILTGGTQLLYFMVGETMTPIFVGLATTLWTLKHIGLPIVNFMRKVVIK